MPSKVQSVSDMSDLDLAVNELLHKGAIVQTITCTGQFLSPIFVVPKPDGSKRFILNLKCLNTYLENDKFKMEDLRTASKLVTHKCYMASIDLKDAYFLIPVHKDHRKYLRFRWRNSLYEFTCLPFGICVAPRVYTKVMRPVVRCLRKIGFESCIYLDDWLLFGISYDSCQNNVSATEKLLTDLGFVINYKKSELTPKQEIKYLGFIINSVSMTISLPLDKKARLLTTTSDIISHDSLTIQRVAEYVGLLVSYTPAVPYGMAHVKSLERDKFHALSRACNNYSAQMRLSDESISDMLWWKSNVQNAKLVIPNNIFVLEMNTDSSLQGWGGYCEGRHINGKWGKEDSGKSINYLELKAAYLVLRSFCEYFDCRNGQVLMRIDNTTAISYINRMGSVQYKNLSQLAKLFWEYCETRALMVLATYIPTKRNIEADEQSRLKTTETEWSLSDNYYLQIKKAFGEPNIDLFATFSNKKCSSYISWMPDPFSENIDAFTLSWRKLNFYAFPPFALVPRVLQKIREEHAVGILVVPYWECQPWFPAFKRMLIGNALYFKPAMDLLMYGSRPHPLHQTLSLLVGKLSGQLYWRKD